MLQIRMSRSFELRTERPEAFIEPPLEAENEPLVEMPASLIEPPDDASHSIEAVETLLTLIPAPDDTSSSALLAFNFLMLIPAPEDASSSILLQSTAANEIDAPDDASNSILREAIEIGTSHLTDAPDDTTILFTIGAFTVTITPLIWLPLRFPRWSRLGDILSVFPLMRTSTFAMRFESPEILTVGLLRLPGW